MKKVILGVDPGFDGGLSVIDYDGNLLHTSPMPIIKTFKGYKKRVSKKTGKVTKVNKYKREMDIRAFKYILQTCVEWEPHMTFLGDFIAAFIEDVHSFPKQGVTSMFSFGMGTGELFGFLKSVDIDFTKVSPIKWKRFFFGSGKKKTIDLANKHAVSSYASSLIGNSFLETERSKVPHDGMAESYLIAEYGRRQLIGIKKEEY